MRKIFIRKELICPFNYCRILIFTSEEHKSMDVRCESCEYVWNRNSTLMIGEGNLFLDENSKEYKEYEMLHKSECICNNERQRSCEECNFTLDIDGICQNVNCRLYGLEKQC